MADDDKKKVKKGPEKQDFPVDFKLLSKDEREALTKEALAAVDEERKSRASNEFFDQEVKRLRRKHIPAEQRVHIVIESASYIPFFMIDGQQFLNGYEYEVPLPQAFVLQEQMQRSWQHQEEINGQSRLASLRRPREMTIGRQHSGTPTRGFDRGKIVTADSLTEDGNI